MQILCLIIIFLKKTLYKKNESVHYWYMSEELIIKNITKTIKSKPILRGVSLQVRRGEIVAILGPNGAGKTSLFYSLVGLMNFDAGEIMLNGQDISELPMYQRARMGLGYLPQESSIFRGLNVEDNILVALENKKMSSKYFNKSERMLRVDELLHDFGISHLRHSDALSLSGGERRRLEIARALAFEPKYILLDEPFAGIDPIVVADIRFLVLNLSKRGIGVLITDHNVRETLKIVSHAYIINEGLIIASGTPAQLLDNPKVQEFYFGTEMMDELRGNMQSVDLTNFSFRFQSNNSTKASPQ